MNKKRRAELTAIAESLEKLHNRVEACKDEEEDYLNNIPENLQGSDKYDQADANVDSLNAVLSSLEEAANELDEVINN